MQETDNGTGTAVINSRPIIVKWGLSVLYLWYPLSPISCTFYEAIGIIQWGFQETGIERIESVAEAVNRYNVLFKVQRIVGEIKCSRG